MSLDHAILGFLQYGPSSGYDLKSLFDLSVNHFWPADQSQIYRTLSRLAEHGWAEMQVIEQEDRPDRKVYHLTPAGREELHRWLAAPPIFKGGRNPFLVQVFFSGLLEDAEILALLRRAADFCRIELTHLRALPPQVEPYTAEVGAPRETFCWMLTLEAGVHMTEAYLAWLDGVIARIESGELPAKEAIR